MQKHFNKKKIEESLKKFQTDQRKFWHWSLKGYDLKHNVTVQFNFFTAQNDKFLCLESELPGASVHFVWSRSQPNRVGAGVRSGTLGYRSRSRP